ncbi:hypothetical protein ACH5RR_039446 [Cinchona calisaya]|uniref:Uncharacterized protein n=1 Tax=Cinchona calisaya TaxID=153742 RepID=A0ABD2XYR9_9GENT
MWVFYGLPFIKSDSILVSTINGVGFVIEFFYVLTFILYSDGSKRRKIWLALFLEALLFTILVVVTLLVLHGKKRSMPVGILCLIFNICMYFSPLTVMSRVIKTKSVKYMPFYLSLANFANGSIWFIYAFLKFDPFVLIPNGLGAVSGLLQLALYAYYYRQTNWDDDDKLPEFQLSDNSARV